MTRNTLLALALLLAALGAVAFGTSRLIGQAHEALINQLADAQLREVDEVSRIVHDDIDQIASDLRFAGHLVQSAGSASERTREIRALLAASKQYHRVAVYDSGGDLLQAFGDPAAEDAGSPDAFDGAMLDTARVALTRSDGELESTVPLEVNGGWFRVFATSLPGGGVGTPSVVAVLVDTQRLFAKLRLVTTDPESHLLLLGARGRPTSATDVSLARAMGRLDAIQQQAPAFKELVDLMRGGRRGLRRIGVAESNILGLGTAELLAAFAPVEVKGRGHWSVATVTSTAKLQDHERAIVLRLALASVAVAFCLLGFAAYLVISTRRAVALRERLRAAERMALVHEQTEKILDNIPTGVISLDAEGRVTALNRMLRQRVSESAVGQHLTAAFPGAPQAVQQMLAEHVEAARSSGLVRSIHGERIALFGEEGQYNLHAVPLDPRFEQARALLVIEDVSKVRALESQLVRAEKLATIGELAAGVAHEMGTPLGVVRGRAEYILRKLGEGHAQSSGVADIVEQIDQVTRTIRQLLDFSRVSPATVQTVDLRELVGSTTDLIRFEADRKKIAVDVEMPADLEPLSADPGQLQQALVNLLKNAFDACNEGGHVILRAGVEPRGDSMWKRVRLEIADDGCGIPAGSIERVFDPFFTTKKRGQGTGLGLSIVAHIVRNHGGEIAIESTEGHGTCVRLLWPLAKAEEVSVGHIG
jgi:two-component system, NtrC family, sensor histidine kinase HydH